MAVAGLPTVIVADPSADAQQELVALLQSSFRCVVTSTWRETAQAILREHPVLVVLELDLPDADGLKLIQRLQGHPDFRRILIACVTQRSSIKDKIAAFRAGADDYLVKPLVPSMHFEGRMLLLRWAGHIARAAR